MEKKKLSAIPRVKATPDMIEIADRMGGLRHIVTAELVDDGKILLLYFYEIASLKQGKTEAAFRTFLSSEDYITQDLLTSKVKWKTASFYAMDNFSLWDSHWSDEKKGFEYTENIFIRTAEEKTVISDFFKDYATKTGKLEPWDRVYAFQESVKERRLQARHKKELDAIDAAMEPIKQAPQAFFDWVWEDGMMFSRYLIYKGTGKNTAECECTHCGKVGAVNRKKVRLRNNEKGECPFCGSKVTIKAKGRMGHKIRDDRWFAYVDPTKEGFVFRYFHAIRFVMSDTYLSTCINQQKVKEYIGEYSRSIYSFPDKVKPKRVSYEWGVYKQHGSSRWCPDQGRIACMECVLYPGNLPGAWAHTPMKYSGLEYLSRNAPTKVCRYEDAIKGYIQYPKLEWICKMGLSNLAAHLIDHECRGYAGGVGKVSLNSDTIYKILGLNKVNTRILQEIDGNTYHLRLLQVAQQIGHSFKPEELKEYYDTFECNTELLKQANRKVSLYKLVKYISRESEGYSLGDRGRCCNYAYMRYTEREDPRIERKKNMAKDWLEYLDWCKALKYDLNNMFIYMPKNFKAVHDRTAAEYQTLQDKKAAAEKRRRELAAKRAMEQTKKAMAEIFKQNEGVDAFSIRGKGLILVVPQNGDEIRAEGAALHHCVGGYVERVARGETKIFFVRKASKPDKPYFTMEWKNNDVVQCRGSHNCDMPPEVKAFVQAFKKKMLEAINQDSKQQRRCG